MADIEKETPKPVESTPERVTDFDDEVSGPQPGVDSKKQRESESDATCKQETGLSVRELLEKTSQLHFSGPITTDEFSVPVGDRGAVMGSPSAMPTTGDRSGRADRLPTTTDRTLFPRDLPRVIPDAINAPRGLLADDAAGSFASMAVKYYLKHKAFFDGTGLDTRDSGIPRPGDNLNPGAKPTDKPGDTPGDKPGPKPEKPGDKAGPKPDKPPGDKEKPPEKKPEDKEKPPDKKPAEKDKPAEKEKPPEKKPRPK